ncbi:ketopantoate reductase family protein [Nocardiopsis potens]|uniref:ketopantoate reductase family protein n=1 Tax=Nocardiopsis potens TaxID=1246458 RepID=UPI001F4D2E58|nr:2-dehydropantoate 2-reductase [Nocardiopsis potens]
MKEFAVLGPGGVGGLLAGLLSRSGRSVTAVATESTAARIREHGIEVASEAYGDFTARVGAAAGLGHRVDLLLVTPKATHLEAALERVPAEAVQDALVVPLLNGFEHMDLLRRVYPGARVLPAAVHVGAERTAPGVIRHTSPYNRVELSGPGAEAAAEALRAAGVGADVRTDGEALLWDKYAFLLPTALVCAHQRAPIGVCREERGADIEAIAGEAARVAAARGVTVDTGTVLRTVAERPAHTRPSLLVDREEGRPMEVDALGGALLRAARDAGVPVPVTERITAELLRADAERSDRPRRSPAGGRLEA